MKVSARYILMAFVLGVVCRPGFALPGETGPPLAATAAVQPEAAPAGLLPWPLDDSPWALERQTEAPCGYYAGSSCCAARPRWVWTVDYRVRSLCDSHTSYEFGTAPEIVPGWTPVSKLDWSLDSTWHGLRAGVETPTRSVHFEWLTPLEHDVHGSMADYDWLTPPGNVLDSLSLTRERWNDGQMIDLGGEFKLTNGLFRLPIEIWPMLGFRWQRFSMTGRDTLQIIQTQPPPAPQPGDVIAGDTITFSQQYYMLYVGGQLRTSASCFRTPVALTFEADWAGTWGYNVDHHLSGYEPTVHRYTMENTSGGAMHVALVAEAPVGSRLGVGLRADHLAIRTTGSHRLLMTGTIDEDRTWHNGVSVKSDQTSITAFLRVRF